MISKLGFIRIGISGWTYAPWRGRFYPEGLRHSEELAYAASRFSSLEINGTFYGLQRSRVFDRWASEAPDNFVFAVKGHHRTRRHGGVGPRRALRGCDARARTDSLRQPARVSDRPSILLAAHSGCDGQTGIFRRIRFGPQASPADSSGGELNDSVASKAFWGLQPNGEPQPTQEVCQVLPAGKARFIWRAAADPNSFLRFWAVWTVR